MLFCVRYLSTNCLFTDLFGKSGIENILEINQIELSKSGVVAGNVFKMPVSTSLETKKMFEPLYVD
ncbi:hypothetical protein Psyaliredsea_28870 [Psychrobacter alimentarius]|nr:hypothetical protein CIK80_09345 [Psychrobacter sp. JB193]